MVNPIRNSPTEYGDNGSVIKDDFNTAVESAVNSLNKVPPDISNAQTALKTIYQYVSPDGPGNTTAGGHTLYLFLSQFLGNTRGGPPNFLAPGFESDTLNVISSSPGLLNLFSTLATNSIQLTGPYSPTTDFVNVSSILTEIPSNLTQKDFLNLPIFIFNSFQPFLREDTAIAQAFGKIVNTTTSKKHEALLPQMNTISYESQSNNSNNNSYINLSDLSECATCISNFFGSFMLVSNQVAAVQSNAIFSTLLGFLTDPTPADHGFDSTFPLSTFLTQAATANNITGVIELMFLGDAEKIHAANADPIVDPDAPESQFQGVLWNNLTPGMEPSPGTCCFSELMHAWEKYHGRIIPSTDLHLKHIVSLLNS
jgi:hypothetical protein